METSVTTQSHEPNPKCGSRKKQSEGTCRNAAGYKTDHPGVGKCHLHGGSMRNHKIAATRELAAKAVATYGLPREIDPSTALLEEVHRTAGHVDWLRVKVAELEDKDLVWGVSEVKASDGKDGNSVTETAVASMWVQLYNDERKRLVDVCKAAISAGIEERRVHLAESQGTLMATAIRAILADLHLSIEQQQLVATIVPKHLRQLTA